MTQLTDVSDPDCYAEGFPHGFFQELRHEAPVCWHEGDYTGGPAYGRQSAGYAPQLRHDVT